MDIPHSDEKFLSQIPALRQLIDLGFEYLTPEAALAARRGKVGTVLLEDILYKQLQEINRLPYKGNEYKGNEYRFSAENLQFAVQRLDDMGHDGLLDANKALYERLTLGLTLKQIVDGNTKSVTLRYIDWQNWKRNVFHVSAKFMVAQRRSERMTELDIVLFVNGIPLAVLECVPPALFIEDAISQSIRNQQCAHLPIFGYAQLLIALNRDTARYGTVGTPARFWSVWREQDDPMLWNEQAESARQSSESRTSDLLFSGQFAPAREIFETKTEKPLPIAAQAETIHGLCQPWRLLELIYKFTVFDNGVKKLARYPQYFAVQRILSHIRTADAEGRRQGGIVWHTQGSGKSLTMVMLARSLAQEPDISNPRIVLVTDRKDLDKQIKDTFAACDMAPRRTGTGRDLLHLVSKRKASVITTLIHKFDKALKAHNYRDDSRDIFMLIDESHRTQFGLFATRMRQMFPHACYLGFTGTPLMKKEKNNFARFGGLIDRYAIDQAVMDKAIVPLLYEARHVEMHPDTATIDSRFHRHTQGLTEAQKAALKKKYACPDQLNKTDQGIYARALDISRHFCTTLQGSGYKGQLIAPDKMTALAYHRYLQEIGLVSSEVIISGPGNREEREDADAKSSETDGALAAENRVAAFWREMMDRYGSEEEYNARIINRFKHGDAPEILIVVDKLQTGFDAPRNAALYISRPLRGHTLLQAIARVNRVHQDQSGVKEFGFIVDYAGILGDLDKALSQYSAFQDFDQEDLIGTLIPLREEGEKLSLRYTELQTLFTGIHHQEARQRLLQNEALRNAFHERLTRFDKTLDIVLSSDEFIPETPAQYKMYLDERKRFRELEKTLTPPQEAETETGPDVDYRDHESRIKEMLNTHVSPGEATPLNLLTSISPINIINANPSYELQSKHLYGTNRTPAGEARVVAEAARQALLQHKEWDPVFYEKFSKLIQKVTDDFTAKRLTDIEYLHRLSSIHIRVAQRGNLDVPFALRSNANATAFFRILKPYFIMQGTETDFHRVMWSEDRHRCDPAIITKAAFAIDDILRRHGKVRFWHDADAVKQAINDIDDYLYDEIRVIRLSPEQMDEIIEKIIRFARRAPQKK
uniref:Type I restriction enzyme endonuclease subunit n=1 Tax=Candidatus Kentrum sp. MB TaxID=2138164 RepID=A0A450XXS2_9GAMM|nr:MAG: type I restriction enzyme, R subunit [Candidatus Kentron sp. MB]VFK34037.1 MAG: type I restriction enzyme, R subunit [Candidatus Kentron sp. MB]VFK76208.1 MAG: type I restriction enzyme, R subunit [Candidatus Kentron sp. MB]